MRAWHPEPGATHETDILGDIATLAGSGTLQALTDKRVALGDDQRAAAVRWPPVTASARARTLAGGTSGMIFS